MYNFNKIILSVFLVYFLYFIDKGNSTDILPSRHFYLIETDKDGFDNTVLFDSQSEPLFHPGFADYCRLSIDSYSGYEGSTVADHRLKKTFVLISPGQRTRVVDFENFTSPDISCLFEDYSQASPHLKVRKLPETSYIYKHMRRNKNPFKAYHHYANSHVCEEEELTPLGTTQHVLLGQYLSSKYSQLRMNEPSKVEEILSAFSIQHQAAYQSMFASLHGLLHEKNFVHVPIQKFSNMYCPLFLAEKCFCPKSEKLQEQLSNGIRKGFYVLKNTAQVDRAINRKLGIPHFADIAPRDLVSFLSSWICEVRSHPCKNDACLNINYSYLDDLFQSANEYYIQLLSSNIFKSHAKLITYPFLERMFTMLQENGDEKMSLAAVEEDFLAMVISVLGISTETLLPQASRLVFEVHESLYTSENLLKVYLNGDDVTGHVAGLGEEVNLEEIAERYKEYVRKDFKNGDYDEECRL